jgi:hypothetical protein
MVILLFIYLELGVLSITISLDKYELMLMIARQSHFLKLNDILVGILENKM